MQTNRENTASGPRFSIVVNNYNYAKYLPQALDSAISQMREGDDESARLHLESVKRELDREQPDYKS